MRIIRCFFLVILLFAPITVHAETQDISLTTGFNFVCLTVTPAVETSSANLFTNEYVSQIFRFDSTSQTFQFQLRTGNGDIFGNQFILAPGEGYILNCTTPGSIQFAGEVFTAGSAANMSPGFAFHGFPPLETAPSANDLLNVNDTLISIFRWNPVQQSFSFVIRLSEGGFFGEDFTLESGIAYFFNVTSPAEVLFGSPASQAFTEIPETNQSAGTGQITGVITLDESATTLAPGRSGLSITKSNIRVWLKNHPEIQAVTDDEGKFTLENVPVTNGNESHVVEYEKVDKTEKFRGVIPEVECRENQSHDLNVSHKEPITIRPSATIKGLVSLEDGLSPLGVDVYIPGISHMLAKADEDGSYTLLYVPEGSFPLVFQSTDYVLYRTVVSVEAGQTVEPDRVVLKRKRSTVTASRLQGNVFDADGNSVPGCLVSLLAKDNSVDLGQITSVTGHFEFKDVPLGEYRLLFACDGFKGKQRVINVSSNLAERITEKLTSAAPVNKPAFIKGTIQDAKNLASIQNALVTTLPPTEQAFTNNSGKFQLRVPPGDYTILVTRAGFNETRLACTVQSGQHLTVTLSMEAEIVQTAIASIVLNRVQTEIRAGDSLQLLATLKDGEGKILSGRTVTWESSNEAIGIVDSSGFFLGNSQGLCEVTARAEGKSAKTTINVLAQVATVTGIDILPPAATIEVDMFQSFLVKATYDDGNAYVIPSDLITWTIVNDTGSAISAGPGHLRATGAGNGVFLSAEFSGQQATASIMILESSVDTQPPLIQHMQPKNFNAGQSLEISTRISDNVTVQAATLHYRIVNSTDYNPLALTLTNGLYTATIPAASVVADGLQYYIEATDGTSIVQFPPDGANYPVFLRPITLSSLRLGRSADVLPPEGILDLASFRVTAVYSDGHEERVQPVWSLVSGGGSLNSGFYQAGSIPGTIQLMAFYTSNQKTVFADFSVRVVNSPFNQEVNAGHGWTGRVFFSESELTPNTGLEFPWQEKTPNGTVHLPVLDIASQTIETAFIDNGQTRKTNFYVRFTARVDIPHSGEWSFRVESNNRAELIIDSMTLITPLAVDPNLPVSSQLAVGLHDFQLGYFVGEVPETGLRLFWNDGAGEAIIPAESVQEWIPAANQIGPIVAINVTVGTHVQNPYLPILATSSDGITFTAITSASEQSSGEQILVRWDFDGNSSWDTGFSEYKSAITSYPQAGNYTVFLQAMDTLGNRSSTSAVMIIEDSTDVAHGEMVNVTGGSFIMGDSSGELLNSLPTHEVTLSEFQIGKYEVTQSEFVAFLNSKGIASDGLYKGVSLCRTGITYPGYITHDGTRFIVENGNQNKPMLFLSWNGCAAYCNWRSEKEGYIQQYDENTWELIPGATGYRLPTEAEWEFAARGGNESQGTRYSGSNDVDSVAWYSLNSSGSVHPAGQKSANELGLFDMSGNVWEYCHDWSGSYTSNNETNPMGPISGTMRVVRGGTYYHDASRSLLTDRSSYRTNFVGRVFLGFRPVLPSGQMILNQGTRPTVTFDSQLADATVTQGQTVTITYTITDPDSNNVIFNLGWDRNTDITTEQGWFADVTAVSKQPGTHSYSWNTVQLPVGVYYLVASVHDGVAPVSFAHTVGRVEITENPGGTPGEMAIVIGGTFVMGNTFGGVDSWQLPTHEVTVSSFQMGKYEITNGEYVAFLNSAGINSDAVSNGIPLLEITSTYCQISHDGTGFIVADGMEYHPLVEVTWFGAAAYCNWLSERDGYSPRYNPVTWDLIPGSNGYRLPTDAEWEYAARGGQLTHGYSYSGSSNINNVAWYSANSSGTTHPIGTKAPNEIGLHDMSGNVDEWCHDGFADYGTNSETDPFGHSEFGNFVIRGGGCWHSAQDCIVSRRDFAPRNTSNITVGSTGGFRIALPFNATAPSLGTRPTISITSQVGLSFATKGDTVEITYTITDPDSTNVTFSLGMDTNQDNTDGHFWFDNATDITSQPGTYTYVMNTLDAPAGSYYIFATIADDEEPAGYAYSNGILSIGESVEPLDSKRITVNSVDFDFVWIPAGTFTMGSPDNEPDRFAGREDPQHPVTISQGFWLGKYEVTQAQWQAVTGNNPSNFTGDLQRPVEMISVEDVIGSDGSGGFIASMNNLMSSLTGEIRLPTEAEWEYACRAGTTSAYNWGETWDDSHGWNQASSAATTHPVGRRYPNAWGLYDMSGNVAEMCQDWYVLNYYSISPDTDPQGPPTGASRVLRGGGWNDLPLRCRSAYRDDCYPSSYLNFVGCRLVLTTGQ